MAAPPCRRGDIGFSSNSWLHSPPPLTRAGPGQHRDRQEHRERPPHVVAAQTKIQREVIAMTEWRGRAAAIGARQAVAAQRAQRGQPLLLPSLSGTTWAAVSAHHNRLSITPCSFGVKNINCNAGRASTPGHVQCTQRHLAPWELRSLMQGPGMAEGRLPYSP